MTQTPCPPTLFGNNNLLSSYTTSPPPPSGPGRRRPLHRRQDRRQGLVSGPSLTISTSPVSLTFPPSPTPPGTADCPNAAAAAAVKYQLCRTCALSVPIFT
ncbi:hypothetical protein DM860_005637 [Cuscuta australis]|uniref:Uncharacterized protein n=1 Tax=Cuscuta australis TaxID=267555 RepID=A0A328DVV4_9ASTE|nr:hypothetical protein DM860_005637 [Cuscuta australis]